MLRNKVGPRIIINGKFLSQKITGVQRYAREMTMEMDRLCEKGEVILAVNKRAVDIPDYKNISVKKIGLFSDNLWEQISLPFFVLRSRGICINLCNMVPILTPHIAVIHDVSFKVNKNFFSKKFALWYNFVFWLSMRRIKRIITVSRFSAEEIAREYDIDLNNIVVTYNGWQHMEKASHNSPEQDTLKKYGLEKEKFFFSMSSLAPNKNLKWIAAAAKDNPDYVFAVSGIVNTKVFGNAVNFEIPRNLKLLGYVSDCEAKELIRGCRAFLFPTFYEGFGIPPLEALSIDAKAIVSDRSCMREIFGDAVYYVDPDDPRVCFDELLNKPVGDAGGLLKKYSWEKSANILWKTICQEKTWRTTK